MTVDVTLPNEHDSISLQELALYHAITEYRTSLGLPEIRLSKALSTTAGRHVVDTRENIWAAGVQLPDGANLHSWSDAYYYSDQRAPEVMWDAPARIGTGYASAGYEISAAGYPTTDAALEGWKASPAHNSVLAKLGVWADVDLQAIGVGVETSPGEGVYAGRIFHVWFGEAVDAEVPEIFGTLGADVFTGTSFGDLLRGRTGDDDIRGGRGDDEIRGGAGADRLSGDAGDDFLYGGDGDDRLYGGSGGDRLYGMAGNDRLAGGGGNDRLAGGDGDDLLIGGAGRDLLTGGAGTDVFVFTELADSLPGAARDVITDFERGVDRIDLSAIDANVATVEIDRFTFVSGAQFSMVAGELRRANGLIEGDVDGDGVADFQIELSPQLPADPEPGGLVAPVTTVASASDFLF